MADPGRADAEASGVDAAAAAAPLSASHRRSDSIDGLKDRLSPIWARTSGDGKLEHEPLMHSLADDEFELLDRSRPEEDGLLADDELKVPGQDPEQADQQEDSPYPEVRAAIRNYDEDLACNTVRAWVIGLALVFVGASMNTLFSLRQPSISIGSLVGQIIAWPLGHAWARFLPDRRFNTLGLRWRLNPGPFTVKEHSVIGVMASVSFSVAYSTDIILAQLVFYKQNFGLVFQLLLTISTQSIGYGIAGVMRKFLGSPLRLSRPDDDNSISGVHDLAWNPRRRHAHERHVRAKRPTQPVHHWRVHAPLPLVPHRHRGLLFLLLHPRLPGQVLERLCLCDLDRPAKPRRQPALWRHHRSVAGAHYL